MCTPSLPPGCRLGCPPIRTAGLVPIRFLHEREDGAAALGRPRFARKAEALASDRGATRRNETDPAGLPGGCASGTIFELRIVRSRVSNGIPCTTLVAAISSSAGSPLKSRAVDARATPKSMGQR